MQIAEIDIMYILLFFKILKGLIQHMAFNILNLYVCNHVMLCPLHWHQLLWLVEVLSPNLLSSLFIDMSVLPFTIELVFYILFIFNLLNSLAELWIPMISRFCFWFTFFIFNKESFCFVLAYVAWCILLVRILWFLIFVYRVWTVWCYIYKDLAHWCHHQL